MSHVAGVASVRDAHDVWYAPMTPQWVCNQMGEFYLDRGIGVEAIAALIMLATFATVRAFQ